MLSKTGARTRPDGRRDVRFKYRPQFGVIVICPDERRRGEVYDRLLPLFEDRETVDKLR